MTKKIGTYRIPFDTSDNQLHYAGREPPANPDPDDVDKDVTWKKNCQFHDTLKVEGMYSGQTAKYLRVVSTTTGHHYTMFVRDVIDVLLHATVDKGEMTATWTFTKRGANFGVAVLEA